MTLLTRLLLLCYMPKALPYSYTSYRPTPLSNHVYILDSRVAKGSLVRRGYLFSKGQDSKAESDKEEGGENTPRLYTTLVSL